MKNMINTLLPSRLLLKGALLTASMLTLSSCNKEEARPDQVAVQQDLGNGAFTKSANANLEEVALMLAASLKEAGVRQAIHAEAAKQFDGDYDILYKNFATYAFSSGEQFKDKLARAGASSSGRTSAEAALRLETIAATFPILNIAVPVNFDKWDANTYAPLVAFRPVDYSEATASRLKAFDVNGKVHYLDAKTDPAVPVIVVGLSERVDSEGQLLPGMLMAGLNDQQPAKPNRQITGQSDGKSGRVADSFGPYRRDYVNYDNYLETLESAGFTSMDNLRRYEDWISGRVELQLELQFLNKNQTNVYSFSGTQKEFDSPRYLNAGLFNWSYYVIGDRVRYFWIEKDDGGLTSWSPAAYTLNGYIGSNYSGSTVTLRTDNNDDYIGFRDVLFIHGIPGTYDVYGSSGGIHFRFTTVQY
jgi:hypothetical protein